MSARTEAVRRPWVSRQISKARKRKRSLVYAVHYVFWPILNEVKWSLEPDKPTLIAFDRTEDNTANAAEEKNKQQTILTCMEFGEYCTKCSEREVSKNVVPPKYAPSLSIISLLPRGITVTDPCWMKYIFRPSVPSRMTRSPG